ncbi:hypothetical protein CAT723_16100 [Corynebacterium ammoniagenes]|uniref:Secreted protein n=1 Tax=Corynebacterium ammoniagenes TaxID=1697 RepID=A0AAV5G7X3_CORAM|nr:hypothetical protein CAT723_16100 [Corynebacterium ammoniagenes]
MEVQARPAQQVPRVRWTLLVLSVLAVRLEHWEPWEQQEHLVLQVQRMRAPTALPEVLVVSEQQVLVVHSVRWAQLFPYCLEVQARQGQPEQPQPQELAEPVALWALQRQCLR